LYASLFLRRGHGGKGGGGGGRFMKMGCDFVTRYLFCKCFFCYKINFVNIKFLKTSIYCIGTKVILVIFFELKFYPDHSIFANIFARQIFKLVQFSKLILSDKPRKVLGY